MGKNEKQRYLLLREHRNKIPLYSIFMNKKVMKALGLRNGDGIILGGEREIILWVTESVRESAAINSKLYKKLGLSEIFVLPIRKVKLREVMYAELLIPRRNASYSFLHWLRGNVTFAPLKVGSIVPVDAGNDILFLKVKNAYPTLGFISNKTKIIFY